MADSNVTANPGLLGAKFAVDDDGVQVWPYAKLAFGVGGTQTEVADSAGKRLPVAIADALPAGTNVIGHVVVDSGPLTDTQLRATPVPVSGTVIANAGTNLNTSALALDSTVAKDATLTGGTAKAIVRAGAKGATTAADVTSTAEGADHNAADVQIYHGGVAKDPTAVRALTSADVVTTAPPANASTNVAQVGGTNVSTGLGASGAGIPRVTVSNDSVIATVVSSVVALNGLNVNLVFAVDGYGGVVMELAAGTLAARVAPFISVDGGSTYTQINFVSVVDGSQVGGFFDVTNPNPQTVYAIQMSAGVTHVKINVNSYTSGTANVQLRAGLLQNIPGLPNRTSGAGAAATSLQIGGTDISGNQRAVQTRIADPASNDIGLVTRPLPPTLTKGTQGAAGFSVQDLKDSGRVNIMWTAEFAHAQTAETLLTITESRDGAATATFTSKVVTNGKRLRVTSVALEVESLGTGTTPQRAYLRMRFNTAGAVTTGSPIQGVFGLGVTTAIVKASEKQAWSFPDGVEYLGDGTKQIGFSLETPDWVVTTATGRSKITITAFEY